MNLDFAQCHGRVTHSRNQADTARTPQDTRRLSKPRFPRFRDVPARLPGRRAGTYLLGAMRRPRVVALVISVIVATSCGVTPSAETSPATTSVMVTVGSQRIAVRCVGADTGRPTIVLMHGNGGSGFQLIEPHLQTLSRVCVYDRPGTGDSPAPAKLPRSITEVVAEAHGVLAAAAIRAPVFLIGASYGGVVAFMYAQKFPNDVAGFISINPPPPYDAWIVEAKKVETPEEVATYEEPDYRGENPEQIDNRANSTMLTIALPARIPYVVMFDENCDGNAAFCSKVFEPLRMMAERLAHVGDGGRFIAVPGAGHQIESTRPLAVSDAVDKLWGALPH
jgi:alpha/beta hydrolase family protein